MKAERDDDDISYGRVRRAPERRLAYEIALGIWIGGMALGLTWGLMAILFAKGLVVALGR